MSNQEMQQTQNYLRIYIQTNIKNGVWKFALRIATMVLDFLITMAVGYEIEKITSDETKDNWTFVEFFTVLILCLLIWIIKCCCLNRFCITCCYKCVHGKRQEGDEMEDGPEEETNEKVGMLESVLNKVHMILNRLAIGVLGYELRKQLFNSEPLSTWDFVEISMIILFCIWIMTIKYCILKCSCPRCSKGNCSQKDEDKSEIIQNDTIADVVVEVHAEHSNGTTEAKGITVEMIKVHK